MKKTENSRLLDGALVRTASIEAFRKLDPRIMICNPVMFMVEAGAVMATVISIHTGMTGGPDLSALIQITVWLWFTVLFANFAEAVAEGRGKARADSLRSTNKETQAKKLRNGEKTAVEMVASSRLSPGDFVLVEAGDVIPVDGEIV
ncbi:MAG TPA: potassium-transporting ATPase subunit B, partial [Thalassospira sp.]|nr:potassium-transporting ATPase subunit B [Thalassospira sp.]